MASLLGNGYESSDDEVSSSHPITTPSNITAAPDVSLEVGSLSIHGIKKLSNSKQASRSLQIALANPTSNALTYNVTYDNLARPNQGPSNPFKA
jgi:pre-mRNA-processing factor 17